ncbi:S8 family serine peptidase [Roseibium sp. HPY-6]|uniref:S8 family serine peptidase n=1 Tax=Roseibium sp. HPY-6 TaxID=3229852 RepID=UPI00338E4858
MIRLIALSFTVFLVLPMAGQETFHNLQPMSAIADDDDSDSDSDSDNDNDNDSDDDDSDNDSGAGQGGQGGGHGARDGTRSQSGRSGGGGSGGPAIFAPLRRLFGERERPAPQPRRAAAPPVLFVAGEIIVLNINTEDLQSLLNEGYSILEERAVGGGQTYYRLAVPDGLALPDARDAVRALPSGQDTDFNHYYRPERGEATCVGENCAAYELVSWPHSPQETALACVDLGAIGMIDTGINEKHPVFDGADVTVMRLADEELPASKASHGTAIAALIVGQPESRVRGLLPHARLVAVDAFHRSGRDERADAFTLVEALYTLSAEGVTVINLSLAGPQNSVVEAALRDLAGRQGIAIAAAAGNGGPRSEPVYPAAYEEVLAVTAVDRNKRVYRRANRGGYIDLAAPGVNVWTAASIRGAKWKTGTSFAVPFATAAIALVRAKHPEKTPEEVYQALRSAATDLGETGHDPVYGSGLLQANNLC